MTLRKEPQLKRSFSLNLQAKRKLKKKNHFLGACLILCTRSEGSRLVRPSREESCSVAGSSLRPQMPRRALGPLTVWEAAQPGDIPKEVAVTRGHVMLSQTAGRLTAGPGACEAPVRGPAWPLASGSVSAGFARASGVPRKPGSADTAVAGPEVSGVTGGRSPAVAARGERPSDGSTSKGFCLLAFHTDRVMCSRRPKPISFCLISFLVFFF